MTGCARQEQAAVESWARRGERRQLAGHRIFTVDVPARSDTGAEPLLVLHGFPTCSFDFHRVVDALSQGRRVLLFDMLGYGMSDKPDMPYRLGLQADVAAAWCAELGLGAVSLLTHDMGDTVGGELLARQADGEWGVQVVRRVVTNGSVYMEMAKLSAGQEYLLALPDEALAPGSAPDAEALGRSLRATFAEGSEVGEEELRAMTELIVAGGGSRLLPRTIRYIEERRLREERWTGAIESHPSPLGIVWGTEDPIAVSAMAERLQRARPDATRVMLDGVGHYPMVEAPAAFASAVASSLG